LVESVHGILENPGAPACEGRITKNLEGSQIALLMKTPRNFCRKVSGKNRFKIIDYLNKME